MEPYTKKIMSYYNKFNQWLNLIFPSRTEKNEVQVIKGFTFQVEIIRTNRKKTTSIFLKVIL